MRTMFLAALFLSYAVGMSSASAQETPNQTNAEILSRMAYHTTEAGPHNVPLLSPAPEFGSLKTFEAANGTLVVPSYSFVRLTEAWRPLQSGQEIQVGEFALRAYSRKHPHRVYQLTGTFAQRADNQATRLPGPASRRDPAREKKLSVGVRRSF